MQLVQNMKVKHLNFGNIEGKEEFNGSNIEELYLDIFDVEKIISERKYYIYGNKGTGKTSLLRYMDFTLRKRNKNTLIILFKDIKQNIKIYSSFKKLISEINDIDLATQAFWQWFLLSIIVRENNIDIESKYLIFNAKNTLFKKLSINFLKLVKNLQISFKKEDFQTSIEIDSLKLDNISYLEEAGESIEKLEDIIKEKLTSHFYIFIDELETSTITSTYREDAILIKNLIKAINTLNDIDFINIVVAIRTEIINNVFTIGDEINKLLESKGIEVKWLYNNYNITHPLIRMIIKKMRASMIKFSLNENTKKIIKSAPEEEIFKRWFPQQLLNELDKKRGDNAKILLHNTWLKPRDLVRLMNVLREKAYYETYFIRKHYDEAIKEYSIKAWQELKEELSATLNEEEIFNIEKALSNFKTKFYYNELFERLNKYFNSNDIEKIIDILYKIGIIGNNYGEGKNNVFKYYYRGDKFLDKEKRIEIHRGLWKVFSLKIVKNNNRKIFNDSLGEKLKNIK